MNKYMKKII